MTQGVSKISPSSVDTKAVKNEVTIDDLRIAELQGNVQDHELPVIGTFVDKRIIPGFLYRVRICKSYDYLFGGRALLLESIGRGYGKRITFESESRNDPSNYFYSDSAEVGYAFAPVAVRVGDQLDVLPISGPHEDKRCGRLQVVNVTRHQREIEMRLREDGICKRIEVHFTAKVLSATDLLLSCKVRSWTSVDCIGVCHLVKKRGSKRAEIDHIDLMVGSCLAGFKLILPTRHFK